MKHKKIVIKNHENRENMNYKWQEEKLTQNFLLTDILNDNNRNHFWTNQGK